MSCVDSFNIKQVSDPRISPDGSTVAFTVEEIDLENNKYLTDIYVVSSEGGDPVNVSRNGNSVSPRWSPDGKTLAYISKEGEERGIWVIDFEGKHRRFLVKYDVSNVRLGEVGEFLCWSPDGSMIAFIASHKAENVSDEIVVHTKIHYRAFKGFADMRRRHIFVISSMGYEAARQITFGDYNEHSISWSPDSSEIAFISNRTGEDDLNFLTDVWSVSVNTGEIRRITETGGAAYYPTWSPDGKRIAYGARVRGDPCNDNNPEDTHIWIVNSDGTDSFELAKGLDRRCQAPKWAHDSDRVLFTAADWGWNYIFSASLSGEITNVMKGEMGYWALLDTARKTGKMAYLTSDSTRPSEVYVSNIDGSSETQVSFMNAEVLEEFYFSEANEFVFPSFDGTKVQGWIYHPDNFDPSKKYPLILFVHGGPHAMYGYSFSEYLQMIPAHGYLLAVINPRGSRGYGQEFSDGCVKDWGGKDYKDYMSGVDYLLATRDYIDAEKLGVWGGSYGGFMTNWVITQTDRFKAAVSKSSVSNLLSDYATSNCPIFTETEIGGIPYDNIDLIFKLSPIMYIKNVKTPTLFLHGHEDSSCPIGQAEEMYMGLKRLGVDTQLVRYLKEGHGTHWKPENRLDLFSRIVAWFDTYLKGQSMTV
jgi:dipeptidyl aminopeptidase/acylaminoacyl peptidase